MNPNAVALVSIGCQPASGRPRRASMDARALELGLKLVGDHLSLLHAGDPDHPVLRDYLGMGVSQLSVLCLPPSADVVPTLVYHLRDEGADIVLTGQQAEGGEDSGMVPYLLGESLGMAVVANVVEISLGDGAAQVLQALPRGQRRELLVRLPFIAAVGQAAPAPRQVAFARSRRGHILKMDPAVVQIDDRQRGDRRPARRRPKRLQTAPAGGAADRLKAASGMQTGGGRVLQNLDPDAAAHAIFSYLVEHGVIRSNQG
ncbi:MAG: electron transfer flavoprotein subunit beta [Gammaproteobacteria bacterium]|nr:electron transfer flavoprotein subunit beta [Gammaproteobacteria bacterium]